MRPVLVLVLLLTSCALGRVQPSGEITGLAVGHARIENCQQGYEDHERRQSVATGKQCSRIEGGSLSTGVADFLTTLGAALAAYFGFF